MPSDSNVREALIDFIKLHAGSGNMLVKVKSVGSNTCTVVTEGEQPLEIENIQLRTVVDNTEAITIYPAEDSYVLIEQIEETGYWIVTSCQEIQKVRIKVGSSVYEQDTTYISIKNEAENLKNILTELCSAIAQITVTAPNGVTSVPINASMFSALSTRIANLLK